MEGGLFELREIPFPALATTGSYPFSEAGGNPDLIGPVRGGPVAAGISITVFAENCVLADLLTKVVLNLPKNRAAAALGKHGCRALVLERDGRFHELP